MANSINRHKKEIKVEKINKYNDMGKTKEVIKKKSKNGKRRRELMMHVPFSSSAVLYD